jgi:6-methylsalicylate decarboxylase
MFVDIHQHLWTEAFVDALERRNDPPYIRRYNGLVELYSAGEPPYVIDLESELPEGRAALIGVDGLDLAAVAISSPIGVEALPRGEARQLIDAWLEGSLALPDGFVTWGPFALDQPSPDDVEALIERGCIGISLPAGALAGAARLRELTAVLERVAELQVPLLVHPGRAPGDRAAPVELDEPLWWRPLTDYVWQMQAAWYTFAAAGRQDFPDLKVVWTMLAGGAHLMHERFAARGGPSVNLHDPNSFYETSSYGADAIEMTSRLVGEEQLVYGSDRPVVVPTITERDRRHQQSGAKLIHKRPNSKETRIQKVHI